MFICICNAIRETDLRAAARTCAGDAVLVLIEEREAAALPEFSEA